MLFARRLSARGFMSVAHDVIGCDQGFGATQADGVRPGRALVEPVLGAQRTRLSAEGVAHLVEMGDVSDLLGSCVLQSEPPVFLSSSARMGTPASTAWIPSTEAISITSRISCGVAPRPSAFSMWSLRPFV